MFTIKQQNTTVTHRENTSNFQTLIIDINTASIMVYVLPDYVWIYFSMLSVSSSQINCVFNLTMVQKWCMSHRNCVLDLVQASDICFCNLSTAWQQLGLSSVGCMAGKRPQTWFSGTSTCDSSSSRKFYVTLGHKDIKQIHKWNICWQ